MRIPVLGWLVLLFSLLTLPPSSYGADVKAQESAKAAEAAKATIIDAKQLPSKFEAGKELRVSTELKPEFIQLFQAAAADSSAQCKIDCDHGTGGITCQVGQACQCGCAGGYSSCGCR